MSWEHPAVAQNGPGATGSESGVAATRRGEWERKRGRRACLWESAEEALQESNGRRGVLAPGMVALAGATPRTTHSRAAGFWGRARWQRDKSERRRRE